MADLTSLGLAGTVPKSAFLLGTVKRFNYKLFSVTKEKVRRCHVRPGHTTTEEEKLRTE